MNENDFESIMSGNFDPESALLTDSVETTKKVIDAAGEVHTHASRIGLPVELANEMAMFFFEAVLESTSE